MEVKEERSKPRSYIAMMAGALELRSNRVQLKLSGVKGTNLGRTVREPSRHFSPPQLWPRPTKFCHWSHHRHPHKPIQPTEKSDGPPMTMRSGSVVKKLPFIYVL